MIQQISGTYSLSKLKPYTFCTTAPLQPTFLQTSILQEIIRTFGFSAMKQHDLTVVFKCFFKALEAFSAAASFLNPTPKPQIIKKIKAELLC